MTRQHTLHVPTAGIRLAWPRATTIVLDPGPDEHIRNRNLTRERCLVALGIVLSGISVVLLVRSDAFDRSWLVAAGLLLAALACQALRPRRRTVPAGLVDLLEPLRDSEPAQPGVIQRLVWEASGLITATEPLDGPGCPDCARRVAQIRLRLGVLTRPAQVTVTACAGAGLRTAPPTGRHD